MTWILSAIRTFELEDNTTRPSKLACPAHGPVSSTEVAHESHSCAAYHAGCGRDLELAPISPRMYEHLPPMATHEDRSCVEIVPGAIQAIEAIAEDAGGWHCEAHPDLQWPHNDCPGPGMLA